MTFKMFPLLYTIAEIDKLKENISKIEYEEARSFIYHIYDENVSTTSKENNNLLYDNTMYDTYITFPEVMLNSNNQITFCWKNRDFETVVILTVEEPEGKRFPGDHETNFEIRVCNLVTQNQLVSIEKLNTYYIINHLKEIIIYAQNYKPTI